MTVRSTMPLDANGASVQVLRLRANGGHTLAVTTTSSRNLVAFNSATRVVEIEADVDMWIAQGDGTVIAAVPAAAPQSGTDGFQPAKRGRLYALGGDKQTQATHIAAIVAGGVGTLYISELE